MTDFINKAAPYAMGTASIANGSQIVTFVNAALIATDPTTNASATAVSVGDIFSVSGVSRGVIQSIDSANQITLDAPWTGASQTNAAYKIYRYTLPILGGAMLTAAVQMVSAGGDGNPDASRTIDDTTARIKLRNVANKPQIAVGASGAADSALLASLQMDPATGAASFPSGVVLPSTGFRNRLINGGFDVWQRGTSFSLASNSAGYTADRWIVGNNFSVAAAIAKVAAPSGFYGQYALNAQATAVAQNGSIATYQRLESQMVADCDGSPCAVSFDVNASTSAGALTLQLQIAANNAVDNGTFVNWLAAQYVTLPVGAARIKIPLMAAQMIGLKYGAQIGLRFAQTGADGGNVNITIGAMQFEKGAVANPFEFRPLFIELSMCQRYYECSYHLHTVDGPTTLRFATLKRAQPTILVTQAAGATASITAGYIGMDGFRATAIGTSDFTWTASAEL